MSTPEPTPEFESVEAQAGQPTGDIVAPASPAIAKPKPPSAWKSLYTQNPFYVISAVLMLYAVRAAYGKLEIGEINCWLMMGVLAAYTLVLAVIGVMIIRLGKVWDDARSILLLLMLLFLAVSISADDLFVNMSVVTRGDGGHSTRTEPALGSGTALLLCGYLFSAIVSTVVLRRAGIRLGWRFGIPYHLVLALFYVAPWCYSPAFFPRTPEAIEWSLLLFPLVSAGVLMSLVPAIRSGPRYVAGNGTPWPWPWFPWSAFGVLTVAMVLRSYALCMTFGPVGKIWRELPYGGRAIDFDTLWGTYFLVPIGLAVLVLLLENGLVTGNRRLLDQVMKAAPLLLVLTLPIGGSTFRNFLNTVTGTIGSPLWITACLLLAFYTWAWVRRVEFARTGALCTLALFAVVGPRTTDVTSLTDPQPWPLLVIGLTLLISGLRVRSSKMLAASAFATAIGFWAWLPDTLLAAYRFSAAYHLLLAAIVGLGLTFNDRFSGVLRIVGAAQLLLSSLVVMSSAGAAETPQIWRLSYVALMATACLAIAALSRNRWYLASFAAMLLIASFAWTALAYRVAVQTFGRPAMTAFSWSAATLVLAFLISAHKAQWLPQWLYARARNGVGEPPAAACAEPNAPPAANL